MKSGKKFDTWGVVRYKLPFLLFTLLSGCSALFAQGLTDQDSGLWLNSNLNKAKKFQYRFIQTQYITNENNFFLDVTADTFFISFKATGTKNEYSMYYSKKENEWVKDKMYDTFRYFEYLLQFDSTGKLVGLNNWKKFRDMIVANLSLQVKAGLITAESFETQVKSYNQEAIVMRAVIPDIIYLFENYGSYYAFNNELLTLKPIKSPFSGYDLMIGGKVTLERTGMNNQNVMLKTAHITNTKDEQALIAEYKGMMVNNGTKPDQIVELSKATLNSEYHYQYNVKRKLIAYAKLADVFALNLSSKGNIREYLLWEFEN